ncbi:MAG: hypothetical protein ABW171_03845 [Steroidobacter sp.]
MNVTSLIGAAILTLPFAASAAENFSYRNVDVARFMEAEIDSDDLDVDGDGIQLRGSLPVYQNFFALAEYQALDLDGGIDATRILIGGGGHWPLGNSLDLVARGGFVSYEVDFGRSDDDDTGLFAGVRIRTIVAPKIEVEAGIEHFEFEVAGLDGDTYLIGEARYNFTSQWSAGAIITIGGDQSVFGAQGRFNF